MKRFFARGGPALALFAALAVLAAGCGKTETASSETKVAAKDKDKPAAKVDTKPDEKTDDHGDWWCNEHATPEDVCDLCSKKYREAEKAKGNWCEHNRVKSSCFKCNPGLKEKFAAEYKEKFGKEPPPSNDDKKKDKK